MTKSAFSAPYAILLKTLINLRRERGISQSELGRKLGRTQPFISYFERGERRIDIVEFYAICRALDADPNLIFAQVIASFPPTLNI